MIYLISDTHFNHKNIIKYENRPFNNIEHMNKVLIENWNNAISDKDKVYHLGDFGWGNKETITNLVSRLNGYKILIKGNHDGHSAKWYHDAGFDDVIDGGIMLDEFYLLTHKPVYSDDVYWKHHLPFINIHGHIHSEEVGTDRYVNVSVEHTEYKPILFNVVKETHRNCAYLFNR